MGPPSTEFNLWPDIFTYIKLLLFSEEINIHLLIEGKAISKALANNDIMVNSIFLIVGLKKERKLSKNYKLAKIKRKTN